MIDERMEETAALHVLGALTPAEAGEFKQAMRADPELKALVAGLSTATGALAGAVPVTEPPPQLRAKVLSQVGATQKILSLPERKSGLAFWFPWATATCLAILCLLLFAQDMRLRQQVFVQQAHINLLELQASLQQQRFNSLLQLANNLQMITNNLQQAVLALQETNRLANLRIAMLNSLVADAPQAIAVSLWDNEKQNGVLVAQNLKALAADRDYELWVMDENQNPVAAGVFHMDASGAMRMDFKPSRVIKVAGKFAVTEEVKGGVASPTLKNLVLASN